jgi:hypothetical protein
MKYSILAGCVFSFLIPVAHALTGADLDLAKQYLSSERLAFLEAQHKDIYDHILAMGSLHDANLYMLNNLQWDSGPNKNVDLGQIPAHLDPIPPVVRPVTQMVIPYTSLNLSEHKTAEVPPVTTQPLDTDVETERNHQEIEKKSE